MLKGRIALLALLVCSLLLQLALVRQVPRVGFALWKSDIWIERLFWSCRNAEASFIDLDNSLRFPQPFESGCRNLLGWTGVVCGLSVAMTSALLLSALPLTASAAAAALVCLNPFSQFLPLFRSSSSVVQLLLAAVVVPAKWDAGNMQVGFARLVIAAVATYHLGWRSFAAVFTTELERFVHRWLRPRLAVRAVLCLLVVVIFGTACVFSLSDDVVLASRSFHPSLTPRWYLELQLMRFAAPGFSAVLSLYPVVVTQLLCLRLGGGDGERAVPQLLSVMVSYLLCRENTVSDTIFIDCCTWGVGAAHASLLCRLGTT
jgi:hypothetical protein